MKKSIKLMMALLMAITLGTNGASADTWDGQTLKKPEQGAWPTDFIISEAAQLAYIRQHWNEWPEGAPFANSTWGNVNYQLYADIDMGDAVSWTALGNVNGTISTYSGTFDGNGHTIRIHTWGATENYQGLFAKIGYEGKVRGVVVTGEISCESSRLVGGIAGESNGTIENCWVSANVSSNWQESSSAFTAKVGGIAGENYSQIHHCCVTGDVTNNDADVGGIVGYNNKGKLEHCAFYGTRNSTHNQSSIYIGDQGGTMDNMYSKDDLTDEVVRSAYIESVSNSYVYCRGIESPYSVLLIDDQDNLATISSYHGLRRNVKISRRTLWKDGSWNTLCLPFDVTISGSVLDGAEVRTVESTSFNQETGTLTLNFSNPQEKIEARKPYIVKWASGDNIVEPMFEQVLINYDAAEPVVTVGSESVAFVGSYWPVTLEASDKTTFYLGSDNKLHIPSDDFTFSAFHALFRLKGNDVGAIALNFGDGETYYSDIVHMTDARDNGGLIESLNGKTVDVCLLNRPLYKDGSWNTICLPFDVTLSGSALDGATARALNSANISGTTLYLNFGDAVSTLKAGTPYIIKWEKEDIAYNAVSSKGTSSSNEDCTKLLDGSDITKWCASNGPWQCVFTTSSPVAVTGYTLTTATDATLYYTRNPQKWTLEAKANAADAWTTIDSRDAKVNSSDALPTTNATESQVYTVTGGNKFYKYFRFTVIQTDGDLMQLAELKLQGDLANFSPLFKGVTIDATAKHDYDNEADGDQRACFLGTYASQSFDTENKSILFMGADNKLYYPQSGATIGAFRAYFMLKGIEAGDLNSSEGANGIVLNFEGETTGISTTNFTNEAGAWYDIQGRRLSGKPTTKGLYINNGKKVVIK